MLQVVTTHADDGIPWKLKGRSLGTYEGASFTIIRNPREYILLDEADNVITRGSWQHCTGVAEILDVLFYDGVDK